MRLDAEFFHPDYLEIQHQLEAISSHRLRDFQVKIRHPKEIQRNYGGQWGTVIKMDKMFVRYPLI